MTTEADRIWAENHLYNLMVGLGTDSIPFKVGARCLIANGHTVTLADDPSAYMYNVDGHDVFDYWSLLEAIQ